MRLFAPFVAAIVAVLLLTAGNLAFLGSWKSSNELVAHTHRVREALDEAMLMALNAETGERGFILTGREEYLGPYEAGVAGLGPALERVQQLTHDNPGQQERLGEFRRVLRERLDLLAQAIQARRSGDDREVRTIVESQRGRQLMDRARAAMAAMDAEEERLLALRERAWFSQQRSSLFLTLAGSAALLALTILSALIVRGDLRRREEIARQRARVYEYQERLTSIVSHDVRNPLSAILVSVKSLLRKRDELTHEQVAALERVLRSGARIESLSSLLVDYTHARLGRGLPTSKAPTDGRAAVERAVEELSSANPSAQIAVDVRTGNARGLWDAERIEQLTSNLVSNALRYGRPNSAITVTLADAPGDAVEIRVHNDGPPIPKETIPTLFEPFKRGEGAEQAARQGLGLGLFIVHEIVRAHAGEIEVRSTEAEGTTFIVRLPRQPPAPAAKTAPAGAKAAPPEPGSGVIVRLEIA